MEYCQHNLFESFEPFWVHISQKDPTVPFHVIVTSCGTTHEAADTGVPVEEIALLGWVDFNAPHARGKDNVAALCKGAAVINEMNPRLSATVLLCPDFPKDSSPRGLYDEERRIFEELFSLNQAVEQRFVEMYARETRRAEQKSNTRRFGQGRITCSTSDMDNNMWLGSELAIAGRPLGNNESMEGAPTAILPRTASILIPEGASPASCLTFLGLF